MASDPGRRAGRPRPGDGQRSSGGGARRSSGDRGGARGGRATGFSREGRFSGADRRTTGGKERAAGAGRGRTGGPRRQERDHGAREGGRAPERSFGRGAGRGAERQPPRGAEEPRRGPGGYGRSVSRAATAGRDLWAPRPRGARRPGERAAPAGRAGAPARPRRAQPTRSTPQRGVRRSTAVVGGDQVEGRQAVRELLAAGRRPVDEVWLVEGSDPSPVLGEIDNLARDRHVPVRMVSERRLESVQRTESPQGVVAFAKPLQPVDLRDLVAGTGDGSPGAAAFLVVVDGVTDPQNLGAILRSAECAGATGAVLPRHRSVHVTAAVAKAAAGAVEHVPIALVPGVPSALQELERLGVRRIGLDERAEASLFDLGLAGEPVALVLGAEGRGLSPLSRRRCDTLARIPLHGAIASLNVATAAAVACFQVAEGRSSAGQRSSTGT